MRITLNLATRPFSDAGPALKRLRIAMAAFAVVAIGLGFGLHAFHQKAEQARARERSLDDKITAIAHERQSFQDLMRQPVNAVVLSHAAALNQLFDEKAFSWTLAMEDLETVLPGGVQVSNLEPIRAKDGQITLHLRVIGPRDRALQLVQNLEHSKHFVLPRMVGESAEATGGPGGQELQPVSASNRINLDLLADYSPPVADESKPAAKSEKPAVASAEKPGTGAAAVPAGRQGSMISGAAAHPKQLIPAKPTTRPPYTGVSRPPVAGVRHSKPNPTPNPKLTPGGPQ
jgi:type IV pilus assembly protein PilN